MAVADVFHPDRRAAITATMGLGAAALLSSPLAAQTQATPAPSVLPHRPGALVDISHLNAGLPGLSRALIENHHTANYGGAVRRLAAIRAELVATDPATMPGYRLNGIKREELIAWNSKTLHEIYFSGLGAPVAPSPLLALAIERDFGSFSAWAAEFSAMGKALGGGSGWVLLTWSLADHRLANIWASDHSLGLAAGVPLLALDMYEHAYALDYGPRAAAYVDAFMQVLDWRSASARFSLIGPLTDLIA
jgi:Fe-Mn family superoxide dismutase